MWTSWDETDGYQLSGRLWRNFAPPVGGGFERTQSGNPAFGVFDHFMNAGTTSLYDGYIRVATGGDGGITVAPVSSEANHPGIMRLAMDTGTANDEAALQFGAGLDVGLFKLASSDLCFEAYMRVSAITAAKWSWFVGLATGGAAGAAITDKCFADTTGAVYGTNSFCGFQKLLAEGGAIDGMYQKSGQTKVDGAVNTGLGTLTTAVAATWVKLGFRLQAHPKMLSFYVDGVEDVGSRLYAATLDAAAFPDDVFLTPTICVKNVAGDTAISVDLDWWACAQAFA